MFENRAIAPGGGGGNLSVDEVCEMAWNQLLFFKQVRGAREWEETVGRYPRQATGVLPEE